MTGHDYDVIIVGAGPVGGHLGRILSEQGLHVLMLEEHKEIGKPFQCAGLVTPSAMDRVGLHHSILSDVWGARIHSPGGRPVEIGEPSKIRTHVVCRKLFDEGCVRQAIEAGATLWVDSKPTDAVVDDSGVSVEIDREGQSLTLRAKLLCGADGVHSWTRRHFRFGRPKEFMVGFQAEVSGFEGISGRLEMFSGEDIAPGLFAWAIPNGDTHRIGVWVHPERLGGRSCEMLYDTLLDHPLWRQRFEGISESARYCGPLACGLLKKIYKERVVLFGDAAGLCKPTTGGGIGPGFDQVHTLAPKLVKAVLSDNLSKSNLKRICKPMEKVRKEQERARILRDLFVSSCDDDELEATFEIFARQDVVSLINEVGDIEKPVPLGIRLLKDVPEFRRMAVRATWALLTG
ncbi:MAG: geranylgeranyl reductase family protein [Candidatus Thermoplasmatota archaeon]|nr:geranylgeranyl reductase family protein [Candidatus Thermoplasmatota archaeon]